MPTFRYTTASRQAGTVKGTADAPNLESLARDLRRNGHVVVEITLESLPRRLWALLNSDLDKSGKVKPKELAGLAFEWGSLLSSGLSVDTTLAISATGAATKDRRVLVENIQRHVQEGDTLCQAIEKSNRVFSPVFLAIVAAAEESSALGPAILRFSEDLSTKQQQVDEVRNALLYPAFILLAAGAAIGVLLGVVVPSIESLFDANSLSKMPLVTKLVIAISHFLGQYGVVSLTMLAAVSASFTLWVRTDKGGLNWSRSLLAAPWLGLTLQLLDAARYLRLLSELLAAGVPLARAVPLASSTIGNRYMRLRMGTVQLRVTEGGSLAESLMATNILPREAIQLIRVGEQTGRLKELAVQAATMYELRGRTRMKAMTTIIGPAFTLSFGAAAGIVVYAIMTTILSINGLAFQ